MDRPTILVRRSFPRVGRRPRRGLTPAVQGLEGRRLLTGGDPASATMSQTATFPDLESNPALSDQVLLYFNGTMGTLTEVDVVTSGSFSTQFSAENLASSGRTVQGTTGGNLSINVPTGAIPVAIPTVAESFNASGFDGKVDDGGTSGETMAPVTSSSTPQTTVLTSPAALAAFTGHLRIPIGVSGHATGSTTPNDGAVSAAFKTDTSATITVIYHYIPTLTGGPPSPAGTTPSSNGDNGDNGGGTATSIGTVPGASHIHAVAAQSSISAAHAKRHRTPKTHKRSPHHHHHPIRHHKARPAVHARHHGPASRIRP
jgi:hypothetical protein